MMADANLASSGDFTPMSQPTFKLPREITYEWSPELVKLGARRFILRYAGWRPLISSGVIALLAAMLFLMGSAHWWMIAILSLIPPLLLLTYYVRATRISYAMPDRQIFVRIETESITFQSSEQTSILKWSGIAKLWVFPDVLILFTLTKLNYIAIPVVPLGPELSQFIEIKVREGGGEIPN
jgi:hypothetical protein